MPFFDYRPGYRRLRREIDAAIRRVLDSGTLILGPEVRAFEEEFARFCGASHAVAVASGTDALALALRAVGIGPGDEVITVANAGVPPVAAIRAAGAVPRFADVSPATLLLDPQRLEAARTDRSRGLLLVHLYGQPVDLEPILAFAQRHGLRVIEDCAHAHGATYRGRPVGTFGEVGCYSFYPTKVLGAFGDAGLCATASAEVAERLRRLRMYGYAGERHALLEGVNSRLDELQAAILRVKLVHLPETIGRRRRLAERYRSALAGTRYRHPERTDRSEHSYHLFVVEPPRRAAVIEGLKRRGIGLGVHYDRPVHLMEAYRFLGYRPGDLPASERACRRVVSLPLYDGLEPEAVDRVAGELLALP